MPAATPVTVPEVEPIVATPVVPLVHVPPPVPVKVVVALWQTDSVPVIAPGLGFIKTLVVAKHPVGRI